MKNISVALIGFFSIINSSNLKGQTGAFTDVEFIGASANQFNTTRFCKGTIPVRIDWTGSSVPQNIRLTVSDNPNFIGTIVPQQFVTNVTAPLTFELPLSNVLPTYVPPGQQPAPSEITVYLRFQNESLSNEILETSFVLVNDSWTPQTLQVGYGLNQDGIQNGDILCEGFQLNLDVEGGNGQFYSPPQSGGAKYAFVNNEDWDVLLPGSSWNDDFADLPINEIVQNAGTYSLRSAVLVNEGNPALGQLECIDVSEVRTFTVYDRITAPSITLQNDSICGTSEPYDGIAFSEGTGGDPLANTTFEYRYPAAGQNGYVDFDPSNDDLVLDFPGYAYVKAFRQRGVSNIPAESACPSEESEVDSILVRAFAPEPILIADTTEVCSGAGPLYISNTTHEFDAQYEWSDGDTWSGGIGKFFYFNEPGEQIIRLFSNRSGECQTEDSIVISVSQNQAPQGSLAIYGNSTFILNIDNPETYSYEWGYQNWLFQETPIGYCDDRFCEITDYNSEDGRLYFVDVTDPSTGCVGRIYYNFEDFLGIEDEKDAYINAYPNPSSGIITLESSVHLKTFVVHNAIGKILLRKDDLSTKKQQIDLSGLGNILFVKAEDERGNWFTKRILVID